MLDGHFVGHKFGIGQIILAGVVISIMVWEIAARYLQPDTMAFLKPARCAAQRDHNFRDFNRHQKVLKIE